MSDPTDDGKPVSLLQAATWNRIVRSWEPRQATSEPVSTMTEYAEIAARHHQWELEREGYTALNWRDALALGEKKAAGRAAIAYELVLELDLFMGAKAVDEAAYAAYQLGLRHQEWDRLRRAQDRGRKLGEGNQKLAGILHLANEMRTQNPVVTKKQLWHETVKYLQRLAGLKPAAAHLAPDGERVEFFAAPQAKGGGFLQQCSGAQSEMIGMRTFLEEYAPGKNPEKDS